MVDLLFILHIITAVVLLLVAATYLVEFSYRNQNYPEINKQMKENTRHKYLQKYKNLRFGKAADGASYAGCYKWGLKKCKSLSANNLAKEACQFEYDYTKNVAIDPVFEQKLIIGSLSGEKVFKNIYCTNEWYKWNASRFIPAILALFFAIVEILFALEKVDAVKGFSYGFFVRIILFLAFGLDILGVSGDLGISAGIILIVLTLVWAICFFVGAIDHVKIGAN
jgi:hypothetical protein